MIVIKDHITILFIIDIVIVVETIIVLIIIATMKVKLKEMIILFIKEIK